ncbi:MAG TPA: hypothetical protein PLO37_24020 [Candidatus Hydrogenedentes bacterium]|nr:hypothetical protein [Candidatus Hydrogenedentota bacterium]HPG69930.1 hypothetical protein [Candidatus Hydrogenedentota bacterium]
MLTECLVRAAIITLVGGLLATGKASALEVTVRADRDRVAMGRTVQVEVTVRTDDGAPAAGVIVLPYVNGKRWGAHERSDDAGRVTIPLPLPNPGEAAIAAEAIEPPDDTIQWIWASEAAEDQRMEFETSFTVEGDVRAATLRVAVDDSCEAYLNGESVGTAANWSDPHVFEGIERHLRQGVNQLCLKAHNGTGPAGIVAALTIETDAGERVIGTDGTWTCRATAEAAVAPVRVLGPVGETGPWADAMGHWPGVIDRKRLFVGQPPVAGAQLSKPVTVHVDRRAIEVYEDPDHLIGMQWEPWFTPKNAYWQTAQAVPVIGFYDSTDRDVIRQHALWLMDAGVNFIFVDWSNHIWGKQHWSERFPNADEIIHATTVTLEAYADMRDEGLPVPKVVIMPGLSNGPPATMEALDEENAWIYENYNANPRFDGLWVIYEGKPLLVPLDCAYLAARPETPPVDDTHFTIRWMGTQFQMTDGEDFGYWSWMDGCLYPVVTYHDGKAEVVTPTPAYFGNGGWLYPEARGRRGGTTYIESFKAALSSRPKFVLLHQFNEFAGQPEGAGYGENHDIYVDSYSVELSDDFEPVSLTAPGYRGDNGGWGFYYLNLTQALVRLFHQTELRDTILAVHPPDRNAVVSEGYLDIEWAVIGREPESYTVLLDGKVVAEDLYAASSGHSGCYSSGEVNEAAKAEALTYRLELAEVSDGPHTLTVLAESASTRFALSYTELDVPLDEGVPTRVDVPFVKAKGR